MIILLGILAALFLILALHPFTTYPLSLALLARLAPRPSLQPALAAPLRMAICVCAYNEAAVIVRKAENLRALQQRHPELEVLIYTDCASDNTAALLEPYRPYFFIHNSPERHGKSYGMNLLVAQSTADIVVFTDANVMLAEDALDKLQAHFAAPDVGCVCGQLIYVNEDATTTAANGTLYWRLEEWIKRLETQTGSVMGADGSIFAIRRALHTPPRPDIIDDMFVSFSILCAGQRLISASDVLAYEESVTSGKEEFRRKIRIACQAFNVHRLLWPQLRQLGWLDCYKYVSHKLLRWFVLPWLILAALCFSGALALAGYGWLALAAWGLGALALVLGAYTRLPLLPQIFDILTAFTGVFLGILKSIRGERFQTWSPAQSIRKQQ